LAGPQNGRLGGSRAITGSQEKEFQTLYKLLSSSAFFLALAACDVDPNGVTTAAPLVASGTEWITDAQLAQNPDRGQNASTVSVDIQAELALRKQEYDAVINEAKSRGLIGGAIQGGLLGILMTGTPEGALVGGVTGATVGYWVSGKAAAQIVEDHRNFLIRKWSIETVLKAALTDTENTRFDLLLSKRALEASRSETRGPSTVGDQGVDHLLDFRERAEGRALVLHEVIPMFAHDPVASERLSELLTKQVNMLHDMNKNVDEITKRHE
jgi:hypothetical protein